MQQTPEQTQTILAEPERVLPDFTFEQLPAAMREALEAMGWTTPMPVQAKAIPYLMDNRDMIVQSRTGSGKTGAFLMPLLMRIDPERRNPQALVLVPTRELAMQVHREFEILSAHTTIGGALLYGGVGYNTQLQNLRDGAQVIIGTPGRVLDHIGRRSLNLDRLNIIVFDEADEMLSMGFYPDMRELRRYLPRNRSSWMFSATMPYKVQMLAREFLHEPEFLTLSAGHVAVTTAEHRFYDVPPLEKDLMLMRVIEFENPESAIIFCNTKVDVEYVATVLRNYGYNVDMLSGDLDQKSREKAMGRIRRGETRFLVATDVAARGIDISDLSHVFQYDVPKDPDSYIHRAGRTARAGNTGVVITLIANISEKSDLKKITRKYDVEFVEMPVPTQEEVEQRIGERLVVILEDRLRTGVSRLERERMKRFGSLVRSLAEGDEERMLLAMLLDEIYHNTYHQPAPQEGEPEPVRAAAPQPARPAAPQPQRQSQPASQAQSQADEQPGQPPAEGEQAEARKKKKKRKKKRNRNRGEQMAGGPAPEGGQDAEQMQDDFEENDEAETSDEPESHERTAEPERPARQDRGEPRGERPARDDRPVRDERQGQPDRGEPRGERQDRPARDERQGQSDRGEPRGERQDRPARDERQGQQDRGEQRDDRPARDERQGQPDRGEPRGDRQDRPARDERQGQPDRGEPRGDRQERPARDERPRDERPARQDRGEQRGDRQDRPARDERPGQQDRAPRQDRPGQPDRGEQRGDRQERPARDERQGQQERGEQRGDRPARDDRQGQQERPARQDRPGQRPERGEQRNDRPERQGQQERPVQQERPAQAERPARQDRAPQQERTPAPGGQSDRGRDRGRDRGNDKGRDRDRDSKHIEVAPEDMKWFDSIEVIEPEGFVEPEGSVKKETPRPERRDERKPAATPAAQKPAQSVAPSAPAPEPAREQAPPTPLVAEAPAEAPSEASAASVTKGRGKKETPTAAATVPVEAASVEDAPKAKRRAKAEESAPAQPETPAKPKRATKAVAAEATPEAAPATTKGTSRAKGSATKAAASESAETPARGRGAKQSAAEPSAEPAAPKKRTKKGTE